MSEIVPERHPAVIYIDSLGTVSSKRSARHALNEMAEWLGYQDMMAVDWSQLRYPDMAALQDKLIEIYKPSTINRYLSILRSVLKVAHSLEQISAEDYQQAIQIKDIELAASYSASRILSHEEISAIMNTCNTDTPVGKRDAAAIALMYAAGLRPTELAGLELSDFHNGKLVIKGSYNMKRTLYIEDGALEALQDWLTVRGNNPGPLFLVAPRHKFRQGKKMTSQAFSIMLITRAMSVGIDNLAPNDLRQSFIKHLLDAGVDLITVSEMAGIKDIRSLMRYLQGGEEAKRKAARILHVPYKKRSANK